MNDESESTGTIFTATIPIIPADEVRYSYNVSASPQSGYSIAFNPWADQPSLPPPSADSDDSESIDDSDELTEYLNQLCSQTGRNFAQMNLDDFHDCETKNDVNKVFFSALWGNKEIPIEKKYEIEVETLFKLANPLAKLVTGISDHRKYASEALNKHNSHMRDLVDLERQVDLFKPSEPGFYWDMVKKVAQAGRWTFVKVTSDKIIFKLTNDCFLAWRDPQTMASINVNMGKYFLHYQPNENRICILISENNTTISNYYHPHVGGNGEICWGNAKFQINKALCQFDLVKICELTALLLHEYNADSPYVRLCEFEKAKNYEISNKIWVFSKHMDLNRIHFRGRVFNNQDWVHENKMFKLMQVESWRMKNDDSDDRYIYANDAFIKLNPKWCFVENRLDQLNWPLPDYSYPPNQAPNNDWLDSDDEPEEAEDD